MVERFSVYHSMIMTPLGDWGDNILQKDNYTFLCNTPEGKDCLYRTLSFGYEVIAAYLWLKSKFQSGSADTKSLADPKANHELGTLSAMLKKRLNQDLIICKDITTPYVIGGNLVVPEGMKITVQHLNKAYSLLHSKSHQIIQFLNSICKKSGGQIGSINSIVYTPESIKKKWGKTYLAKLIELIDFPIPSIYVLLKTLGYNYFPGNPYLDADNEYGKCQCIIGGLMDDSIFRIYYTDASASEPFSKYKFIPKDMLLPMILDDSAFLPIDYLDAQEFGIITNDEV